MSHIDLNAIRAREAAATKGPWDYITQGIVGLRTQSNEDAFDSPVLSARTEEVGVFASHAREDIPALLAEVAGLTKERDAALRLRKVSYADHEDCEPMLMLADRLVNEAREERDAYAAVIAHLVKVGTGELRHLFRGRCPDEVEGFDSRDPGCPACGLLGEMRDGQLPRKTLLPQTDGVRDFLRLRDAVEHWRTGLRTPQQGDPE